MSEQEQPRERMNRVGVGWEQDAWEEGEARISEQGQEWEEGGPRVVRGGTRRHARTRVCRST